MASYTQIAFGQVFRFRPSVVHFLLDASRWRKLPLRAENWIPGLCNIHFQRFASFFAGRQCSFSFFVVFKRVVAFSGEHRISGRLDFAKAWTQGLSKTIDLFAYNQLWYQKYLSHNPPAIAQRIFSIFPLSLWRSVSNRKEICIQGGW